MNLFRKIFLCASAFSYAIGIWADGTHTFPAEGKTYLIHRFGDANSYIYESGTSLCASPNTKTQKQYWQFIPTQKDNCYYIQNVTSKKYVQSSNTTVEAQIKVGADPVEFEIKPNTTEGAAPKGYYYMCSTDQTIDTSKDGTLGLNYQQSSGKVVAYYIRYNRGNSYWDIVESSYDYEAPAPITRSDYSRQLGVYVLPCGEKGDAHLRSLTISGAPEAVRQSLQYVATAQPSTYYLVDRKDTAQVVAGSTFHLNYEATNLGTDYTVTAYFDWNADGEFETSHAFLNNANGTADINVPDSVKDGKVRMRIRITDNGMEEADDDVHGQTYDFQIFTVSQKTATSVAPISVVTKPNNGTSSRIYGLDGRRVKRSSRLNGVFIQGGMKVVM